MFLTENGITFKSVPEGWMVMIPGQPPVSYPDLARAVGTLPDACAPLRAELTLLAWDLHLYTQALPEQPLPIPGEVIDRLLPEDRRCVVRDAWAGQVHSSQLTVDTLQRMAWAEALAHGVRRAPDIEAARRNLERLLTAAGGPKGGTRPNAMGSSASNASNGLSKPFAGQ